MLVRYVLVDLFRNPRRTLSTVVGVLLGIGLFCGVLFFVDGLSASMTQRAVAPLAIDMQRVVTQRVGSAVRLTQTFDSTGALASGTRARVVLDLSNDGDVAANEVTVRSRPTDGMMFVPGSAEVDGVAITRVDDNPFDHGAGHTGHNVGTIASGEARRLSYLVEARADTTLDDAAVESSYSSRESVAPVAANESATVPLDELAAQITALEGVASASPLSLADLGVDTLSSALTTASGPTKIFGLDAEYAARDTTIEIVAGDLSANGGVVSAEAARALGIGVGDTVTVALPDASTIDLPVSGVADLSRSRSLFSSRRGGDLETFVYARNSVIVSSKVFADTVQPAYDRAAAGRGSRLKNPPIREVDITVDRDLLAADPATAVTQTERIAADVGGVAAHQDYVLDNISNTLAVATADARVAKRLFVFLGVPGGFLAAMLAAYAGTVLAGAQRREQATVRIRGASRRHLLRMLALRASLLTAAGAVVGLLIGYAAAAAILGRESLVRASAESLARSALLGTIGGLLATGIALYLTGRRSIDREIDEDRARLALRPPLWRRARLDIVGVAVVVVGTAVALRANAFDGAAGSVYFGRAVELNLALLVLPIAVWMTGSLLVARAFGTALSRSRPRSTPDVGSPLPSLYRASVGRRPWAISNSAIIISLIVALATSLAGFTASYDAAKVEDARYANGADIRITPSPTAEQPYAASDSDVFRTDGVADATPVIYGLSNVIMRSARTSDPANLAAVDPATYASVAPFADADADAGSNDAAAALRALRTDPTAILVSADMADFLRAEVGDTLNVLLARATDAQVEVELHIVGLFERLPGFPDGADALMSIDEHTTRVPAKPPDFFLASAAAAGDAGLQRAVDGLEQGPAAADSLQIDTRTTTLARDQSSLAALNIAGLVDLDSVFSLSMAVVTVAIFVFGLLLQRRREYVTLRAQGLDPRTVRLLVGAEAATAATCGVIAGLVVGVAMGYYFVNVLRPLFVLAPKYTLPVGALVTPVVLILVATLASSIGASRIVNTLQPTELLRDE